MTTQPDVDWPAMVERLVLDLATATGRTPQVVRLSLGLPQPHAVTGDTR